MIKTIGNTQIGIIYNEKAILICLSILAMSLNSFSQNNSERNNESTKTRDNNENSILHTIHASEFVSEKDLNKNQLSWYLSAFPLMK